MQTKLNYKTSHLTAQILPATSDMTQLNKRRNMLQQKTRRKKPNKRLIDCRFNMCDLLFDMLNERSLHNTIRLQSLRFGLFTKPNENKRAVIKLNF